jgi:hypothetical protein
MTKHASVCRPEVAAVALSEVADRVGTELADLAAAIHRLQILISPLLKEARLDPAHVQELQHIDHIYQKVGNLAEFLAALAPLLPDHWTLDPSHASQVITLSDLASRLGLADGARYTESQSAGDCDFFDF